MGFSEASKCGEHTDSGALLGSRYPIACKVWFTSEGNPQPLSFKFEGEDGSMQYVKEILILSSSDRYYSGIASKEFDCEAIIGGLKRKFRLLFYPEKYSWVMVV